MTQELEPPYLYVPRTVIDKKYNPKFGDERICQCGHMYYRHFDSWDNNYPIGCKYCECEEFKEVDK
jgi:hypothetical protein